MNEIKRQELPAIGSKLAGGYYTGIIQCGETQFAIITSPKSLELNGKWGEYGQQIEGCNSVNDCHANTKAMAESGSEIAQKVLAIEFDGFNDWAIPSRDALELQYRHFKPTEQENYCSFRDGDNPSSVPPGHLYTEENPLQTSVDDFKDENAEAFDDVWYWSSTQSSAYYAYVQAFGDGTQYHYDKGTGRRVRPVRRLVIC